MILKVIVFLIVMSFVYTLIAIYIEYTDQNKNEDSDFGLFIRVVKKLFFDFDIFKRFFFELKKSKSKKILLNVIESIKREESSLLEKEIEVFKKVESLGKDTIKVVVKDDKVSFDTFQLMDSFLKETELFEKNNSEIMLEILSLKILSLKTESLERKELEPFFKSFNEISFSKKIFSTIRENKTTIETKTNFSNNISKGELKYG